MPLIARTFGKLLLLLSLMTGCMQNNKKIFRDGDLLFRGRQNGSLSEAIDEVTQTGQSHHYTHMGIILLEYDTVWVMHAAPKKGVCKETIELFCASSKDEPLTIGHYRVKKLTDSTIKKAINKGRNLLGEPYNYSYILPDSGYYCSEFIYELFSDDGVFKLEPMTFKDPATGNFHQGWTKHYHELGIEIPEGLPGCNPNGMATSEKLEFIRFINEN